jgi:hypothetical protein
MTSTELLAIVTTILGIIGIYFGAQATRVKNQSQRQLVEAQSAQMKAEGDLVTVKADAEVKIAEAKTDIEERAFIRAQAKTQLNINETFLKMLTEIDARNKTDNEANYRSIRNVQNDTNTVLVNMLNAMRDQHALQIGAIGGLPAAIQMGQADTLKNYAQQLGAEIGAVLTKQFQMQTLEREMYPFPDPEDPAWQTLFFTPVTPEPTIHKQPLFADAVKLHKPCAVIQQKGEWVRAILGRLEDWIIIEKRAGDSHCWGWLPKYTVQVSQTESVPT